MRGPQNPRLEGEGVVVRAVMNELGRLNYYVKPDDKSILKRASAGEQKEKLLHANLEDLAGGPWSAHDPEQREGRKVGAHGDTAGIEKLYHVNVRANDKGQETLEQRSQGFSEMELMGWLRIITREMEVRLIGKWANDINFCSFCGHHANVAGKLVAGAHNTRICKECTDACRQILTEKKPEDATSET